MQLTLPSGIAVTPPTAPRTTVEQAGVIYGDPLSAKLLEADVAAAVAFHRQKPMFQGIANAAVSLTTSTWTPMTMAEIIDNVGGHSDSVNTARWYAPATANATDWYLLAGVIPMTTTNATSVHAAGFRVNGGTVTEGMMITSGAHNVAPMVVDLVQLASGDYLELCGYQNDGITVTTVTAAECPVLTVRWVCSGTGTTVALPATPRTWAATDAITADSVGGAKVPINVHLRDVIRWLNYPPTAKVTSTSTAQTIPTGATWTSIQMPTPIVDNYGMWSSGANTRLTAQRAGLYLVVGQSSLAEINPSAGYRACRLQQTLAAGGTTIYPGNTSVPPSTATNGTHLDAVHLVRMAVGDYVELQAQQTQGAAMTVKTGSGASKLIAHWKSL
jgi:hypothetical protein